MSNTPITKLIFGLMAVFMELTLLNAKAASLPEPVVPDCIGINIHFSAGHWRELDMIQAVCCECVRTDFTWARTERIKGVYDWSAYDQLTENLEKRGIRPYFILDYSNPLYEEKVHAKKQSVMSPRNPESVNAYSIWAAAAAKHFQGHRVIWEIWNEPNGGFWFPRPDASQYATLMLVACKAIRQADPQATIVGPATSRIPHQFLETVLSSGVLEYLDAVTVHPYRKTVPESAAGEYVWLRGLIAKYAPNGRKNIPVISGEWGYANDTKGVSLEMQAAYLVRQQLANLLADVPLSVWYDWRDDGTNVDYNEHNFGTVSVNLAPKPAYVAMQTLIRELSGYHVARRLDTISDDDYALLCVNDSGDQKLAIWTVGEPHALELGQAASPSGSFTAVDGRGKAIQMPIQNGHWMFSAGPSPIFITLANRSEDLAAAAAWKVSMPEGCLANADSSNGVPVLLELENPFSHPVWVHVSWQQPGDKMAQIQFKLNSREATNQSFDVFALRRDAETANVKLRVEFYENDQKSLISASSEVLVLAVASPLELKLLSVANLRRLQIQNAAGEAFQGSIHMPDGRIEELNMKAGQNDWSIDVPAKTQPSARVKLFNHNNQMVGEIRPEQLKPVLATKFFATVDGDTNVQAKASLTEVISPGDHAPFPKAYMLDYQLENGRILVRDGKASILSNLPQAEGVWIWGDNSGNQVKARLTDSGGQTFQFDGPKIRWRGWRWVIIKVETSQFADSHWGGANDGIVHGHLQWDCPLLLQGGKEQAKGTIYFCGLSLIYL